MLSHTVFLSNSSLPVCSLNRCSFLVSRSSASSSHKVFLRSLSSQDSSSKGQPNKEKSSTNQNRWAQIKRNLKYYVKSLFYLTSGNAFNAYNVEMRHILDKLPTNNWCLIYEDRIGSFVHKFACISLPFIGISVIAMVIDGLWHFDGQFTVQAYGDIFDSLYDFGYLAVLPLSMMLMVSMVILRLQHLRLLRMYLNKQNPKEIKIFITKGIIFQKTIDVKLSEIKSVPETIFRRDIFLKQIFLGHAQMGGRRVLINGDCFLANNYCSYLFGQTKVVPKNLNSFGLPNIDNVAEKVLLEKRIISKKGSSTD